ncbi:MAG: hypothetical protein CL946_04805 [Ectothiorhodospiraceae bacterium]|nr:hypothetical protein [Ectothiorhodospiraceae bacterium]
MRISVRQKIQIPIIGFIVCLSFFMFMYFPISQKDALEESSKAEVESLARMAAHGISVGLSYDDYTSIRRALDFVKTASDVRFVALVSDGETVAAHPEGFEFDPSLLDTDSLIVAKQPLTTELLGGDVYVGRSMEGIQRQIRSTVSTAFWVALGILIIGIVFSVWIARLIVRPLRLVQLAAIKVGQGDLTTVVPRKADDEIGDLADEFSKMVQSVHSAQHRAEEAYNELQSKNEVIEKERKNLAKALAHLKNTQAQLISAEKMAALGQLIAGIAHEINTPLGAIRASIGNIATSHRQILQALPELLEKLPEDRRNEFLRLIRHSTEGKQTLSAKEERKLKRELIGKLEEMDFANADELGETLADMGIFDDIGEFQNLLRGENAEFILDIASKIALQERNSRNINIAVERAAKIVFALKNYSRQDHAEEKVRANIADGIETVLTLYHNQLKHGIEVTREYEELPEVLCYPDELNQVWTNLIHNSIQAMDNKGTLDIQASTQNGHIVVTVTDSGVGIPEDIKERIFEPFFTTKESGEGTGLGLDIVHRIVEKHNGHIDVDSVPGRTSFRISIPIENGA